MGDGDLCQEVPYGEKIRELLQKSIAPETRRAYRSQLKGYFVWAHKMGLSAFPSSPTMVASYVAYLAESGAGVSKVTQALAAIAALHRAAELTSPTESTLVKKTLSGFLREHGTARHQKEALTADVLKSLLMQIDENAQQSPQKAIFIRNAAILALGFAGAFRRSELSALNLEDLRWTIRNGAEILLVSIRRSKTDQRGEGMTKAIFPANERAFSPTELIKEWLALLPEAQAPEQDGDSVPFREGVSSRDSKPQPLFRQIRRGGTISDKRLSDQSVNRILKDTAQAAGLSLDLSAHSLRSGFVTTAIRQGKTERSIMNQTGHRSYAVLRQYFRREDAIEDNAAKGLL